jgi:hypothetical protein
MPGPRSADDGPHKPISALLRELGEGPGEVILLDSVIDHFGRRAFGALLFVFAVPNLLPLPPGSTTLLGLPLVLIAPQLALGVPNLWLPRALGRRRLRRGDLRKIIERALPQLMNIERLLAPRHGWVFGRLGDRMIGLVCALLAIVLILPVPFGNILPSLTIAALSLGLAQRDGLVALIGYGLATLSVTVLALTFGAVMAAAARLGHVVGL